MRRLIPVVLLLSVIAAAPGFAEEPAPEPLSLPEFIRLAGQNDSEFETILIDELIINYQKDLSLPAGDLVLAVKHSHELFLDQDRSSAATEISLEKLFPATGTRVDLAYDVGASIPSSARSSRMQLAVAQPIARNAFGRSTRLLDRIVGLEMEVARHQVVEAYEDYLALITTAYCQWYEAWENLNIGRSAYRENLKLMDDIRARQRQSIALPIDVNKVELQVLAKKERLLELEERLKNSQHLITTIIRHKDSTQLVPTRPAAFTSPQATLEVAFARFEQESRTFAILKKLEQASSLQVDRDADDLFPSIELVAGYELQGENYGLEHASDRLFAGFTIEWPFPDRAAKAELEVAKVLAEKSRLETDNTWHRLYAQLASLYFEIEREAALIKLAEEKITLARAIVRDETANYSFGKVSLNDYIQAVNVLDSNRFSKIRHEAQYRMLLVEWLRLTDSLIDRKAINTPAG